MRVSTVLSIALMLLVEPAFAGDFETGMERYFAKDYSGAVAPLRSSATQGNANAQAILGAMYSRGQGVPKDDVQAAAWTAKAAQQGRASAQAWLGNMYRQGIGVPQDFNLAYQWFEKAALQGNALGQFSVALAHSIGQGIPQSDKQATFWYAAAAEQGMPEAQLQLGLAYEGGKGVAKDETKSAYWFEKAATQGVPPAQHMLGIHFLYGIGMVKDSAKAAYWLRKAAAQGIEEARPLLAELDAANQSQTFDSMKLCERRATAALDDGVSPADVIATAVVTRCSRERDTWMLARQPDMTPERLRESRIEVDRLSLPGTTATVLEFRAAKRQMPATPKNSPAKPKQPST